MLISSGTRDLLLSQSVQLASLLREFGVDVDLRIRDGLWHVYEWDAGLPEAIASIKQAAEFVQNSIS
jgi:acetyl esterase/lipase